MKTMYIEKVDKPKYGMGKIKMEGDNCKVSLDLKKERNIKKIIKKLIKREIQNIVLDKELIENKLFINSLYSREFNIFNGMWLERYLSILILEYIVIQKRIKKEETEIAVTVNQVTDLSIDIIKKLSKDYKRVTIVTKHIEKFKKIEKDIYDKEGILIIISNNQKKSLLKSKIILNMDFNKELLNKYKINEKAIILNLEGNMKIDEKRFNGININDYEITVKREETIWRKNMEKFRTKDLLESVLYMRDSFDNICKKISKNKVCIKELYGVNGKIESFS